MIWIQLNHSHMFPKIKLSDLNFENVRFRTSTPESVLSE